MRFILMLIFILSPLFINAAIYKWTDESGVVHYSDAQRPGSVEVNLPPSQSYQSQEQQTNNLANPPPMNEVRHYNSVKITKPEADETVRNNLGEVAVTLDIQPALQTDDKVQILLDNKTVGQLQMTNSMTMNNVDRGAHEVQARILDADGNVVGTAEAVKFYMHRAIIGQVTPFNQGQQGGQNNPPK